MSTSTSNSTYVTSSPSENDIICAVNGTATGPYPGPLTESGTASLTLPALARSATATFTITAAAGTVTGTTRLGSGGVGTCNIFNGQPFGFAVYMAA